MIAFLWIDWSAYHVARFRAAVSHPALAGNAVGIEVIGGPGIHANAAFRTSVRTGLSITTLFPDRGWCDLSSREMACNTWAELNRLDPSAIFIPGYYTAAAVAAACWAKMRGRTAVLMSETIGSKGSSGAFAKRALVTGLFDRAITGGARGREYLIRLGFTPDRIGRYYNVVDNQFFAEGVAHIRRVAHPADFDLAGGPYFLFCGRYAPEKNLAGLLRAYRSFRARGGTWPLVLAGDGPLAPDLKSLSVSLSVCEHVRFTGFTPTHRLLPYYAFAGCFILPSVYEPWGLVVNEAMACGLPVLVSDRCGSAVDLVSDGENGFLFNPEDEAQICDLMLRIATCRNRDALSGRSREIIAEYSLENWAAEVARIVTN